MSDGQSDGSSSSSESGDFRRDPFDVPTEDNNFVEPSLRSFSDEEHSPSQYQAQKLRDDAAHGNEEEQPPDLISSDDEDEEESSPVKHTKHSPPKIQQPEATEEIYSKFINMGRQFVAQLVAHFLTVQAEWPHRGLQSGDIEEQERRVGI